MADAIPASALATGGAVTRDQQLREIRDIMRGGRGGYIDLGFNYLPFRTQTPLESPYGEHEGYAFKHHFAGFGSGEVTKNNHLGFLLWFERSGWDGEDFFFWPVIKVVSSAYLRLLIFLLANLIPACASSSLVFCMMYCACKLNKQHDHIQP